MNIKLYNNILMDGVIICVDFFIVIASYILSNQILSLLGLSNPFNVPIALLYSLIIIFMFYVYDFYTTQNRKKYSIVLSTILVVLISTVSIIVLNFAFGAFLVIKQEAFMLIMPVIAFEFLVLWKLILLLLVRLLEGKPKLLVIESKNVDDSLARKIKYSYVELYEAWYNKIDVNDEKEIQMFLDTKFKEYESIFISPSIPEELRDRFLSQAVSDGKEVYFMPNLYNISFMKNETVNFDDTPALRIRQFGLTKLQIAVKRAFDIIASLIGVIITFPIMIAVAIAIKVDSKGNVFYLQERLTYNKKKFNVYKFRTMIENAEKSTGPTLATTSDPRITKVGKVIRSTRLDELPQLFNILFGSMSIVGPRPERQVFVDQFCKEIANYEKRFFAKAGLTGLAQVYARYDTSPQDKTLYDLLYIRDYSFWVDMKLILLTIKIVFTKESSDGVKQKENYPKQDVAI